MYLEQRIKKRIEDRNLREPIKIFFKGIHVKGNNKKDYSSRDCEGWIRGGNK